MLEIALFLKNNLKPILIAIAGATILFFIAGFFIVREKLHDTEDLLAQARIQIENLKKDVSEITKAHIEVAKTAEEYRKKSTDLSKQLERRGKKPISELARKHAKLVEKAINSGTKKALDCMEVVSSGGDC